ncbi:MAG: tRNA (adenosine(37)-N6)-threonylcarbamoyltransferase complex ATPase subunit type 1 TsaE [Gammaproteobacteria bacterium]|nr:tRNA (adenosine(37)-N6)-threonylcarbamoyltransferase complex ATPase subunit type 1 TsaE [Gammaproteobacteria bacterium]MDH3434086.1 tRNA (adenosine(37)-N6)-threonylcarbamoyltransferase complex ATPase subunit type 1 TsaE [Gammaproteobacteria bacterium]
MKAHLPDAAATEALARQFLAALPDDTAGWTLLLEGELGAGKSTFARALISFMGHSGPIPSPTYTLVEPYQLPGRIVYHIDLYRVSDEEELRYLGWTEMEDGFRLIEWPERVAGLAETADLIVRLAYAANGRDAEISSLSPRGEAMLARLVAQASS